MSPRWLSQILREVRARAERGRVRFTHKALRELAATGAGLDPEDARDIIQGLAEADFFERVSSPLTGEWLYVFKPDVAGATMYVKLILRAGCVVVSFHEDEVEHEHEGS